jgi:alpha-amylase/alpha-mannosidase (GH57 family)
MDRIIDPAIGRYVCIHGHFYQPPRENPWLEAIESQPSAYPYHDWNERVTAECYAPNAFARINNYSSISFNFGPTLLSWLEEKEPEVYRAILAADAESGDRFSGHGSALAQAYNHAILPLANERDRRTQVAWGIEDFRTRFGREPEGMWLPETAADTASLETLAEAGIRFTILAPHQAARRRAAGEAEWRDVGAEGIDTTRAYRCALPSGRSIAIFFYDGPISRAVAFERLLSRGEDFAARLTGAFAPSAGAPQLVHIATDGETYGHHHRHGDMALAWALSTIAAEEGVRLTNYGEFLERHPPEDEVEIAENTSWSCAHGVERWRSDCGCRTGTHPDWRQEWRAPLREALDFLRDELAPRYEAAAGALLEEPWKARDAYAEVILDRSDANVNGWLAAQAGRALSEDERVAALKLLELQRHAQLMYTSCGWFFDDLGGIEARQIVQYAGRALQLAGDLFGPSLEEPFLERLSRARSNSPDAGDGRRVYEQTVRPATVSLERVGAHYAVSSLFTEYEDEARVYCYEVEREDYRLLTSGRARLALGRATIASTITEESERFAFGALHLGDHNLSAGVIADPDPARWRELVADLSEPFRSADLTEILRRADRQFGSEHYALRRLFRDEQQRVLAVILRSALSEADASYRALYEEHAPLLRFLASRGIPPPRGLKIAAELALSTAVRHELESDEPDPARLTAVIEEAGGAGIALSEEGVGLAVEHSVERLAEALRAAPGDLARLEALERMVALARSLPFEVDFWKVQNAYYQTMKESLPESRSACVAGADEACRYVERFVALGERLSVRVDENSGSRRDAAGS